MADFNSSFRVTDGVDYPQASQYNRVVDSTLRAEISNSTTMSGTATLTDTDFPIQRFNCNGANRIVLLPAYATTNHVFFIINATGAAYTLDVQSSAGVSLLPATVLADGQVAEAIPDGTAGYKILLGYSALKSYFDTIYTPELKNTLINGGFDFASRLAAPGTLTTITDKKWGADRWQQFAENASWQYNQNDATGETGLTSKYYGLFKKITNTGKGIFAQKVEGINSVPLRSKTVIFQIKMKASASKTIKIALLELQNAGTMDSFPAALASAFGADTVNPTWGANVAVIGSLASCSVTTSWQSFSVSGTVPSNSKNVVCVFWTDSQFAANDTLSAAEAGLFVASTVQTWIPRPVSQELLLCQRYCWAPPNSVAQAVIGTGIAATTAAGSCTTPLPVLMRAVPTLTISAAADFNVDDYVNAPIALTGLTLNATYTSNAFAITNWTVASGATQYRPYNLSFNATGKLLYLDAEIA